MSEKKDEKAQKQQGQDGYGGSPTTEQMRTVGQRRRDAEEKLEHHLEEARHREDSSSADAATVDDVGGVESRDVADIQNDDGLTAADRMDLIANQALASEDDDGPASDRR
jgi:hypothetical protein